MQVHTRFSAALTAFSFFCGSLFVWNVASAAPEEVLPPPENIHASTSVSKRPSTQGGGWGYSVLVTWDYPKEVDEYAGGAGLDPVGCELQRLDGGEWVVARKLGLCQPKKGEAESFGHEPGSSHTFRVILYVCQDPVDCTTLKYSSPPSETVTVRLPVPGQPTLDSRCTLAWAQPRADGEVPLSWKVDPSGVDIEEFELQRSRVATGDWATIDTEEYSGGSTKYVDTGLEVDGTYYYRVRSVFSDGATSDWSNVIKEKATEDDDWCDTDRAVKDRDADPAKGSGDGPGSGTGGGSSSGGNSAGGGSSHSGGSSAVDNPTGGSTGTGATGADSETCALDVCDGECVDTNSDARHCGSCGNACESGSVCNQGECSSDCGDLYQCGQDCVASAADCHPAEDEGCGCRAVGSPSSGGLAWMLLGIVGVAALRARPWRQAGKEQ